ncbi:hypothetical protein ACGFZU_06625 [Streptomyces tendae]|uniref:hypothetical protein n=1 Tax=Streptomyces tendae TaxID=1932 RepID=UPI003717BB27
MSAPPWGHKPPPVDDVATYWTSKPPAISPRCNYWIMRHHNGTWRANRWLRRDGYHTAAERLGVWIWEYLHLIRPLFDEDDGLN